MQMNRIIRVDMSTMKIIEESISEELKLYSGRALGAYILSNEVDPLCNPLGENNKLIFSPGLLGGTIYPCSGRISAISKSPLTGGIKEANSGGTAGNDLASLGVRALILEGLPSVDGPWIVIIKEDRVLLEKANDLKGLRNYECAKRLREKYGKKISIISIGPMGERLKPIGSILVSDPYGHQGRLLARGGLGAVMGSKGLKAIVIDTGNIKPKIKNKEDFSKLAKDFTSYLREAKEGLTLYGTMASVEESQELGCLPTRNFRSGTFELADNVSGHHLREVIKERGGKIGIPCMQNCPIRCSNVYVDKNGNFVTSTLQYEVTNQLGPNCGIGDFDEIAPMAQECDDLGMDGIEVGVTISVCMEAGIIDFGDAAGAMNLIKEMENDTLMGKILTQGAMVTGRVFGVKRVPVVKGQAMPAYDPRANKGTGVTYVTSPMGADHTAGNLLPGRKTITPDLNLDLHDKKDKAKVSQELQLLIVAVDSAGLCYFSGFGPDDIKRYAEAVRYMYGNDASYEDFISIAKETLKREWEFNEKAGLTKATDRLPEFFYTEKLPPYDLVFDVPESEIDMVKKL